ncbi:MAG: uroporphyrinogen decarboxylase family protein [Promethearchaeota archaeon]
MNARERYLAVYDDIGRKKLDRVPTHVQDVKIEFFSKYEDELMEDYEGDLFYNVKFDAPYILGYDSVFAGFPSSIVVEGQVEVELDSGKKVRIGLDGQLPREGSSYYKGGAITSMDVLDELRARLKEIDNSKAIEETISYYEKIGEKIFPVLMVGGIFDRVWQGMGMNVFARHFRKRTKLYRELVDYFAEIMIKNVEGLINATGGRGKIVNILDDVAYKDRIMISKERWKEDYLPYYKKVNKMIEDAGMIRQAHTDGDITELVPLLMEAGFQGLQGWEGSADPYYINDHFPDFVVVGFGDVSQVLPFGTLEEVDNHVKMLMDALKENRHYICGPSTVIVKEMPLENVQQFMKSIWKYGKY